MMKRTLLALILMAAPFLAGCRESSTGPVSVDAVCNDAVKSVTLPRGAGPAIVVQVGRDSECPVTVAGVSEVKPGNVLVRPKEVDDPVEVTLDCGKDDKKKCRYSYLALTRPRESVTLAKETVSTNCDGGTTVLDLGAGFYRLEVEVSGDSKCPVKVDGSTVEVGKKLASNVTVKPRETSTITLSCGSGGESCKYKYVLTRRGRGEE